MDVDTFLKELGKYDGNIMIGKYRNHSTERELVYFWQDEKLYRYVLGSGIKSRVDAVTVRRELVKLLQIKMEAQANGRTDTYR